MINVDLNYVKNALGSDDQRSLEEEIKTAHEKLENGTGKGNDFLGWLELAAQMKSQVPTISTVAKRLREQSDVVLVIGIGGSYLGAKAALEALGSYFTEKDGLELIFVGNHISSEYIADLSDYLKDKRFSINVISKSGTTTEPALAFRHFKTLLEEKVGKQAAAKHIVATTDESKGALRHLADEEGYDTFVIPDDVGGRYSVLSPVGLLPIAIAGIDINSMLDGAIKARGDFNDRDMTNPVYQYVMARNALYAKGRKLELFVHYEPKLAFIAEWWKQLFGESEGKENKGIYPASAGFTTDLHSLGQYIQEGERHLFETVLSIKQPARDFKIPKTDANLDGLNYLSDLSIDTINKKAMQGTMLAHMDGEAPSILIELQTMDAYHFGYLMYFFELSVALSGYVLGVNPFDQPGVEAYKKNMFALLEKPGFEAQTKAIKKRFNQS